MDKFYKVSLIIFPFGILIAGIYCILAIYIHDSLQIWHKPFFRQPTYSYTIRESARAFIRDYDFDSIIIGNSFSENTSAKEASELLGGKFFNLSISGSTTYEKKIILNYLFKHKKIKQVVYILDGNFLSQLKDTEKFPVKNYDMLYNNNPFDDINIYLKDRYFWCNLLFQKNDLCIGKVKNLDKPYAWDDNKTYNARFGGFDNWIKNRDDGQIKIAFNHILITPLEVSNINEPLDEQYLLNAHRYIDENLYDVISKNKDVKFYIVIPPVSNVKLAMNIRDKLPTFAKSADMINYMVKKNNTYSNVEMYAFNDIEDIGDVSKYKDLSHFEPKINSFILKSIAKKEHIITTDNIEDYVNKVYNKALSVDFEYYYNSIKKVQQN